MKIPQKIYPCPIIEAIVEIRFESNIPSDAVFGVVYNEFKDEYTRVDKLPILQLPETLRAKDPNLKYQPYYKLIDENYLLQIGPNVLSVVNTNEYVGWNSFSKRINNTFYKIGKIHLISNAIRLGIRYVNFFETDIFKNINLRITLDNNPLLSEQITFRSTLKTGNFLSNLQILNKGKMVVKNINKYGSIIDIDTYFMDKKNDISPNLSKLIEMGHEEEKILFFKLLKSEFLARFNPEYS
jgi:uncharacterized protein (TIGR04255 family)